MIHNTTAVASILIFIGLILFCVGFNEMSLGSISAKGRSAGHFDCRFCGKDTSAFVLVDCTVGFHLILCIVAVVLVSITSCVGYFIHHEKRRATNVTNRAV